MPNASPSPSKLETLCHDWGYESIDDALNDSDLMFDSVSPGICMNPNCDYSTEVEPDCRDGWCEECGTNSIKSLHELLGVI